MIFFPFRCENVRLVGASHLSGIIDFRKFCVSVWEIFSSENEREGTRKFVANRWNSRGISNFWCLLYRYFPSSFLNNFGQEAKKYTKSLYLEFNGKAFYITKHTYNTSPELSSKLAPEGQIPKRSNPTKNSRFIKCSFIRAAAKSLLEARARKPLLHKPEPSKNLRTKMQKIMNVNRARITGAQINNSPA